MHTASADFAACIKMKPMKKILLLLTAMLLCCCSSDSEVKAEVPVKNITQNFAINQTSMDKMYITIGGMTQKVTLVNNAATQALVAKLQQAPVTVTLNSSGGFEIWGALGFSLPSNNQQITAQPGDVILYSGSNICLFYGTNSWSYTRLGKIDGLSESELRTFLKAGENNIGVTLSLTSGTSAIRQIISDDGNDVYYSLNGQRVTNPSHGIYIKNGKKVIL